MIHDPAPAQPGTLVISAIPIRAVEGTSFNGVVASFMEHTDGDPIGNYTAAINWGDGGTSAGTIAVNPAGGFYVTATHTFAEEGFYAIVTTVTDSDGSSGMPPRQVVNTSPTGDISYRIDLDTSYFSRGTTGFLALQFKSLEQPLSAQPAVATISQLIVSDGTLTSAQTGKGGVSGRWQALDS